MITKIYHKSISDIDHFFSIVLRNIHRVTICQDWCKKKFILLEPEGENVDVLNQGGVGGGLNICDVEERKMIRSWDVKFVVGEVLAGHLAKSYKVGREAFFSPIIKLMLLLAEKVSSAIL